MKCFVCQSATQVTNSRTAEGGRAIKRRRECTTCGKRFTTYERIEVIELEVAKRDGGREQYSRGKLESGIRKALEKRPVNEEHMQKLIVDIEDEVFNLGRETIPAEQIGHIVLAHLQTFDKVAYLRFASVYRNFRSTRAFEREIEKLQTKQKKEQRTPRRPRT